MTVLDDELTPAPPATRAGNGRTQLFVDQLHNHPGDWTKYPHTVTNPKLCASKYPQRFPGTEWALNRNGRLIARWIGT